VDTPAAEQFRSPELRVPGNDLILLSGRDLQVLLKPKAVIEALHQVYASLASNRADHGRSLGFAIEGGTAHIKAGLLPGSRAALAAKLNVNLPNNWKAQGLPTIQGVVLLADTITGRPLAVMDSMILTAIRTAATAMLAASFGARPESKIAAVIGCGMQARYQVEALQTCFAIEEIRVFDTDKAKARSLAEIIDNTGVRAVLVTNVSAAVDGADICVTCTTSTQPVLTNDMSLTGCFVAAMGADNSEKSEIEPALLARSRIFVDDLDQCATGADLAHALRAGVVSKESVHADLADLASGARIGRNASDQLIILDSSGSGIQDVAAARLAYETARTTGAGMRFDMTG
jgi:ornithine cyclodeaminase/alanine dehydrogenase-like protein (mu-crystallin family)